MTLPPFARRLLAALTLGCTVHAAFGAGVLAPLLARFDAAYVPPGHLEAEADDLAHVARSQAAALAPRLTLEERLDWTNYTELTLDLSIGAELPLYNSRSPIRAELQEHRFRSLTERAAIVRALSRAQFSSNVLTFALVTELAASAEAAISGLEAVVGRVPADLQAASRLAPRERDLLTLHRSAAALAESMTAHSARLMTALTRAVSEPDLRLVPSFDEAYFGVEHVAPTLEVCLRSGPEAHTARSLVEQRLLAARVESTPDLDVSLFASGAVRSSLSAGGTPPHRQGAAVNGGEARVGVTARLGLPEAWGVGGGLGTTLASSGASQSLRVTWPPSEPRSAGAVIGSGGIDRTLDALDPLEGEDAIDLELTYELERISADISRLLMAEREAKRAVEDAELKLAWFLVDVGAAPSSADPSTPPDPLDVPLEDPVLRVRALGHRADVGFARLGWLTSVIDVQVACGVGEFGGWHRWAAD